MGQICPLVLDRRRPKWVSHLVVILINLVHLDFKARIFIKRNVFELTTVMLSEDSFPIVINIIKIQVTRLPNHRRTKSQVHFWFITQNNCLICSHACIYLTLRSQNFHCNPTSTKVPNGVKNAICTRGVKRPFADIFHCSGGISWSDPLG